MKKILIDEKIFKALVRNYNKAVKEKKETFFFKGEWLTSYAKYVIEYLKPKFYAKGKDKS